MHEFAGAFSTSYLVAVLMGMFSTLHCLAMCGSIIGSLSLSLRREIREQKSRLLPFVLCYNLGRTTSYAVGGAFAGLLEHVLSLPFAGGQGHRLLQLMSALVIAAAGLHVAGRFPRFAYIERAGARVWALIEPLGRRLIPVSTLPQAFVFGMIWGWLPCGLVYAALALSATTGDVFRGAATMFAFGLGTLPATMGVGIMTSLLVRVSRFSRFRELTGFTLIALSVMAAFPWLNPMVVAGLH